MSTWSRRSRGSTEVEVIAPVRLGCMLATGFLAFSSAVFAGQRVSVEGAPVTVEVPEGWVVAPISSDSPMLGLTLCDPMNSNANSCRVLGEMDISQLTGPRAPASLDALQKSLQADHAKAAEADRLLAPRRLTIAGRDALESAFMGQVHYNHGSGKGSSWNSEAFHMVMVQDGPTFYRCTLRARRSGYTAELRRAITQFCSSIQFTGEARLSGKS